MDMTVQDWEPQHLQGIRYWLGVVFFISVLSSLCIGGLAIYKRLSNSQLVPMRDILISGERRYVNDADLQQTLDELPMVGNFFSMDVDQVQKALVALPWVAQVSVRKQWPNKLKVYLDEHQVAARWNQQALLNDTGQVFVAPQQQIEETLVELSGPNEQSQSILAAFHQFAVLIEPTGLGIINLDVSDRHSWILTLTGPLVLHLGRRDQLERVARFTKMASQLEIEELSYVDLRYDTGFAVGHKEQQQGMPLDDQSNG